MRFAVLRWCDASHENGDACGVFDAHPLVHAWDVFDPTAETLPQDLIATPEEWGEQRRNLVDALLYRRAGARVFMGRARRRSSAEVREARAEFVRVRESAVGRYRDGGSAAALAREFRVSPTFVAERLAEWGAIRREGRGSASSALPSSDSSSVTSSSSASTYGKGSTGL